MSTRTGRWGRRYFWGNDMTTFDLLIRGGTLVDGTGSAPRVADIGVKDGVIAAIGNLGDDAARVIDATGQYVTPGFIDQHTHYDAQVFWDPYCSNSGEHGTTTTVMTNCGFGLAPCRPTDRDRVMLMLENTEEISSLHMRTNLPWDWETWGDLRRTMDALPKGLNMTSYIPMNPLMLYVMGPDGVKGRRLTPNEIAEMRRIVGEAMDLGAAGVSVSLMGTGNSHRDFDGSPMPSDVMHVDDVIAVCQELTERNKGMIQVISQIGPGGDRTNSEKIAMGTGRPVNHNVFLAISDDAYAADIEWLDRVVAAGADMWVHALLYPGWTEGSIEQLNTSYGMQPEVNELVLASDSPEHVLELVTTPAYRERFRSNYRPEIFPTPGGFDQIIVLANDDPSEADQYRGRTLADIAASRGTHVVDALLDVIIAGNGHFRYRTATFINPDPEMARRYWQHPRVLVGASDGGAHVKSMALGCWTTFFLIDRVRDLNLVPIEEMVHQMTLKPANALALGDRGSIEIGKTADVLVFDLASLYFDMSQYEHVYDLPNGDWRKMAKAGGYSYIVVNGEITHDHDKPTGVTPGRLVAPVAQASR